MKVAHQTSAQQRTSDLCDVPKGAESAERSGRIPLGVPGRVHPGVHSLAWICCVSWLLLLAGSFLPGSAFGAENVWSVEKLNGTKPWDKFVESALPIRVEGRLGGFGGGQLRLLRCDAKFMVDSHKLRSVAPKSTIELTGRFRKDGSKLEFTVEELRVVPSYVDQYDVRSSRLKRGTSGEWNELGDWISQLGRFYEDAELIKKGDEAYTKAIETEYAALKPDDAEGRFSLATRIDERKLSARRKMELVHEGLHIRWQRLQKATPADLKAWQDFTEGLADHLSGTTQPILKLVRELQERYELDPVSTYRKADDELRNQLHRLFFVFATRKRLLQNSEADGRDGEEIADQIAELIPEEAALAEDQRRQNLTYRVAHLETATRTEIEDLAVKLRERNQNDKANQALVSWVKSHESRLKGDGIVGLLQLAEEYLSLLNKEAEAVEYLADAYRIDPTYEETKTRFAALGYQWRNSRWSKAEPGRPVESTMSDNKSPTGIRRDMSATDLRNLLGEPSSLSRAITSRGITEVWSYGPAGTSRLVVQLEQKGADATPKVTAYSNRR